MSFPELANRFIADLERGGATVIVEGSISTKPARLRILTTEKTTDCLVFLWNITPGGGGPAVRPPGERRIQVTAADRFPLELAKSTLVGGWSDEVGVWGFWDVMRHTRFSLNSPSFQVQLDTLERASHDGVSTQKRKTARPEIVVAVSPEFLLWFVEQGVVLHHSESDHAKVPALVNATPEVERDFVDSSRDVAQVARRIRLVETMRAYREARFRPLVLAAYSHQCAVCPISLKLVDAAHIVPVTQPGSTDDVPNGLALCRLHHAAFDNGLIGVRPDYQIVVNPSSLARLEELNLARGIDDFRRLLRPAIRHPSALEVRPDRELLKRGMQLRNFAAELIE